MWKTGIIRRLFLNCCLVSKAVFMGNSVLVMFMKNLVCGSVDAAFCDSGNRD